MQQLPFVSRALKKTAMGFVQYKGNGEGVNSSFRGTWDRKCINHD